MFEKLKQNPKTHVISEICNKALWEVANKEETDQRLKDTLELEARRPISDELAELTIAFEALTKDGNQEDYLLAEVLMAKSRTKFPIASANLGISALVQQRDRYKWLVDTFKLRKGSPKVTKKF